MFNIYVRTLCYNYLYINTFQPEVGIVYIVTL